MNHESPRNRRRQIVGAREKLNEAFAIGSLLVAAVAGYATGSFLVFLIATAVLIGANLYSGDIRPGKRRW
jgi:hypothetical protein